MAGQFMTRMWGVSTAPELEALDAWLAERSVAGWEPLAISTHALAGHPQVLVMLRREVDESGESPVAEVETRGSSGH